MADERDDLVSKLIEAKTGYNKNVEHNFIFQNELTVQITLAEYRNLIQLQGVYNKVLSEEREKRYKLENEVIDTKKRLAVLAEKLAKTQTISNSIDVMEGV